MKAVDYVQMLSRSHMEVLSIKGFGAMLNVESSSIVQDIYSSMSVQSEIGLLGPNHRRQSRQNVSVATGILLYDLFSRVFLLESYFF